MIKEQAQAFGQRVWTQFKGFTPGQKFVTVAAIVAVLVGGYFFLTWKKGPAYAPLYTNLGASDASAIVDKLNSESVPYHLTNGGTEIDVPQDKVYSTRLTMSSAGLPDGGDTGYSLLDKEGVTTSQFKQQIDYQRAIEGELDKTIQSISGVTDASVHLAIPQQDVFNDGSQQPTAAVLLTVSPGAQLTTSQVQSVVYLVSSSVPGMKANSVTVSDSNGNVLSAPGQGITGAANAATQTQMTQAYDNQIAASIQHMIDTAIGPGHATVTANSVLNFDQTRTTERNYVWDKNTPPVSQSETKQTYKGAGSPPGGVAGSNGSGTDNTTGSGTGAGKYTNTSNVVNNALGTVTKTTQNAPGALEHLNIAVSLDKSVQGLDVPAITKLVKSGVGYDPKRDQLSVQAMTFDNSQAKAADAAAAATAKAAAAQTSHDKFVSMIKTGALGLLVLLLIVTAWLASRKRRRRDEDDTGLALIEPVDDEPQPGAAMDLQNTAAKRRSLIAAADNQPDDFAKALSGWLGARES